MSLHGCHQHVRRCRCLYGHAVGDECLNLSWKVQVASSSSGWRHGSTECASCMLYAGTGVDDYGQETLTLGECKSTDRKAGILRPLAEVLSQSISLSIKPRVNGEVRGSKPPTCASSHHRLKLRHFSLRLKRRSRHNVRFGR